MAISCLNATTVVFLPQGRIEASKGHSLKHSYGKPHNGRISFLLNQRLQLTRLDKLSLSLTHSNHITHARSASFFSMIARAGAEGQTQTLERPTSVIQNVPGKEKSPQIDDGGTGLPPRDDDGGGGGGGGGGGNFSGGFFFFGFLAFLGFLKEKESDGDYE